MSNVVRYRSLGLVSLSLALLALPSSKVKAQTNTMGAPVQSVPSSVWSSPFPASAPPQGIAGQGSNAFASPSVFNAPASFSSSASDLPGAASQELIDGTLPTPSTPIEFFDPNSLGPSSSFDATFQDGTPDPPLDPRTLENIAEWGGPDPWSIESPFVYRSKERHWRFLMLGQHSFGDSTWESTPYLDLEQNSGITMGAAVRFLDGPMSPNLNPRMYDFVVGYQHRATLLNGWSFDVAANVGAFSDFEGSATEGIRFPGHAVLTGPLGERARWVAGVDYLDRDDFALLPIAGIRFEPFPDLQIHAEFPRPMIRWLADNKSYYFRAELGGGTWAVEPEGTGDDVMTYREIGVYFGNETRDSNWLGTLEIGYASGRQIDYRSGRPSQDLPDGWVIRMIDRF